MNKPYDNEIVESAKKVRECTGGDIALDDIVHDRFSKLASEVCNQGIEAQLKWLRDNAGEDLDDVVQNIVLENKPDEPQKEVKEPTKEMLAEFKKAINGWTWPDKEEKEMVRACKADRASMRRIIALLRKKKYVEAGIAMTDLDTIVRDVIPKNLYDLITDNYYC